MKTSIFILTFFQLFLFSSISFAETRCQDGGFWQTWFDESQFIGFGNTPSKNQIANAQLDKANQFFLVKKLLKITQRHLSFIKKQQLMVSIKLILNLG